MDKKTKTRLVSGTVVIGGSLLLANLLDTAANQDTQAETTLIAMNDTSVAPSALDEVVADAESESKILDEKEKQNLEKLKKQQEKINQLNKQNQLNTEAALKKANSELEKTKEAKAAFDAKKIISQNPNTDAAKKAQQQIDQSQNISTQDQQEISKAIEDLQKKADKTSLALAQAKERSEKFNKNKAKVIADKKQKDEQKKSEKQTDAQANSSADEQVQNSYESNTSLSLTKVTSDVVGKYSLQVAQIKRKEDAEKLAKKIMRLGYTSYVTKNSNGIYRMFIGASSNKSDMERLREKLNRDNRIVFKGPWIVNLPNNPNGLNITGLSKKSVSTTNNTEKNANKKSADKKEEKPVVNDGYLYGVNVSYGKSADGANRLVRKLKSKGYYSRKIKEGNNYRVVVGRDLSKVNADLIRKKLNADRTLRIDDAWLLRQK